jgi:hypothetical protein
MPIELSELVKQVLAHLKDMQVRVHKIEELAPDVVAVQYDFMEDDVFVLYFPSNKGDAEKWTAGLWVSKDILYSRTWPKKDESWLMTASARLTANGVSVDWYSTPKGIEIPSGIRA